MSFFNLLQPFPLSVANIAQAENSFVQVTGFVTPATPSLGSTKRHAAPTERPLGRGWARIRRGWSLPITAAGFLLDLLIRFIEVFPRLHSSIAGSTRIIFCRRFRKRTSGAPPFSSMNSTPGRFQSVPNGLSHSLVQRSWRNFSKSPLRSGRAWQNRSRSRLRRRRWPTSRLAAGIGSIVLSKERDDYARYILGRFRTKLFRVMRCDRSLSTRLRSWRDLGQPAAGSCRAFCPRWVGRCRTPEPAFKGGLRAIETKHFACRKPFEKP